MADFNSSNLLQAEATNYGGFTIRNDFTSDIYDAIYRESPFWATLNKKAAAADIVRQINKTALPTSGFSSKTALGTASPQAAATSRNILTDPGQEIKCVTGLLNWADYYRALSQQQGQEFGDQVAIDTDDLLTSMAKTLERCLYAGNATTNPLEFNGIAAQMASDAVRQHLFLHDLTVATAESLSIVLPRTCAKIVGSRDIERSVNEIHTTAAGYSLLQEEWARAHLNLSEVEYIPGVKVPGVLGADGKIIPIVVSRYLDDDASPADGDNINYWLLDKSSIEWHGVVPVGGSGFNPQIFDLVNLNHKTEQRMGLCYGTLFARGRGQGISCLRVKAANGKAWSYTG